MLYYTSTAMALGTENENIRLGRWSHQDLDNMLRTAAGIEHVGKRVEFVSRQFLGTAYQPSTLIGDPTTPELFTINLEGVDCFTFLDYIEAMRRSSSYAQFTQTLKRVRYRSAKVSYTHRRHFFTDWRAMRMAVADVTTQIGGPRVQIARKRLNRQADGTLYLEGIPVTERAVSSIPTELIDGKVIAALRTGDYVGIYTDADGLDVSHVGIIIRSRDATYLRHASSVESERKVVDQQFASYIAAKPGIVVLRPRG